MTRHTDDLLAVWRADEHDVCSAEDVLSRVARAAPITRRRRAILAVAAAVIVIVGVVATFVALQPDQHPAPHAGLGVSTGSAVTTAPSTRPVPTPTPSASPTGATAPTPTRVLYLGDAHTRVPARWFAAPYLGEVPTIYIPIVFLSTEPFTGMCSSTAPQSDRCTTQNLFPPRSRTPADGLIIKWGQTEYPDSTDLLKFGDRQLRAHTLKT